MKVVIDARLYGWEHAGPGRYVKNLVDNLVKIDKRNEYTILLRKKYFNRLNFPNNFKKSLAEYNHYTFKEQIFLPITLYKEKPDIVHFPMFNVPIFFIGRFIVTIHDLTMHKFKGGEATTRGYIKNNIWRLGYHIAFIKAIYFSKAIVVPSRFVKDEIVKYYNIQKNKIVVTYEGVDDAIKETSKSDYVLEKYKIAFPYFIYSGSAYPHKNLKTAIEAIKLLNKNRKDKIIFVMTSSRSVFTKRILEWAKDLGAENYIKHIGYVPDGDLASLFNKSLAYVFPTLSEGFGLPGLEAMSAGALVIASNIKILKEIYSDCVIYFEPTSSLSLVNTMKKVIDMPEDKKRSTLEKGKDFIKKYSWEKMAKETLGVYKDNC